MEPVGPLGRPRKGRRGIRLDWFGVRVALGAAPGEAVRFAVHLDVIVAFPAGT